MASVSPVISNNTAASAASSAITYSFRTLRIVFVPDYAHHKNDFYKNTSAYGMSDQYIIESQRQDHILANSYLSTLSVLFGPPESTPDNAPWRFDFKSRTLDSYQSIIPLNGGDMINGPKNPATLWNNQNATNSFRDAVALNHCRLTDDELTTTAITLSPRDADPESTFANKQFKEEWGIHRTKSLVWRLQSTQLQHPKRHFVLTAGTHYHLDITFKFPNVARKNRQNWKIQIGLYANKNDGKVLFLRNFTNFIPEWLAVEQIQAKNAILDQKNMVESISATAANVVNAGNAGNAGNAVITSTAASVAMTAVNSAVVDAKPLSLIAAENDVSNAATKYPTIVFYKHFGVTPIIWTCKTLQITFRPDWTHDPTPLVLEYLPNSKDSYPFAWGNPAQLLLSSCYMASLGVFFGTFPKQANCHFKFKLHSTFGNIVPEDWVTLGSDDLALMGHKNQAVLWEEDNREKKPASKFRDAIVLNNPDPAFDFRSITLNARDAEPNNDDPNKNKRSFKSPVWRSADAKDHPNFPYFVLPRAADFCLNITFYTHSDIFHQLNSGKSQIGIGLYANTDKNTDVFIRPFTNFKVQWLENNTSISLSAPKPLLASNSVPPASKATLPATETQPTTKAIADYNKGKELLAEPNLSQGDIIRAIQKFEYAAAGGHIDALYWAGSCYEHPKYSNLRKAFHYFSKASEKLHFAACLRLGCHYLVGNECEKNSSKAFEQFVRGINNGIIPKEWEMPDTREDIKLVKGQLYFCLSKCYRFGIGVAINESAADFHWMKAHEQFNQYRPFSEVEERLKTVKSLFPEEKVYNSINSKASAASANVSLANTAPANATPADVTPANTATASTANAAQLPTSSSTLTPLWSALQSAATAVFGSSTAVIPSPSTTVAKADLKTKK